MSLSEEFFFVIFLKRHVYQCFLKIYPLSALPHQQDFLVAYEPIRNISWSLGSWITLYIRKHNTQYVIAQKIKLCWTSVRDFVVILSFLLFSLLYTAITAIIPVTYFCIRLIVSCLQYVCLYIYMAISAILLYCILITSQNIQCIIYANYMSLI